MTIRTYPFSWLTPYLVPVFEREPARLSDYLKLSRADWHWVGFVVALLGDKAKDPDHFAAVEGDILHRKRKLVLADVAPDVPPQALKLLPKLLGEMWRPPSYRRLAALSMQDQGRKALTQMKSISRRKLRLLHRLPPELRTAGIASRIFDQRDVEELSFALAAVRRLRPDLNDEQIVRSLGQVGYHPSALNMWMNNHYRHAAFPPAPWVGTDELRPITSYADLKRLALEFDNCVRTYHLNVLDGTSYFYRYAEKGKPVATIELKKLPGLGWSVGEIHGPNNDSVSSVSIGRIRAAFAQAGIGAMPEDFDRSSWFRYYS